MADVHHRLVLVTGLSGAGLSTALDVLEDIGYETIDNLPLALLEPFSRLPLLAEHSVAVSLNTRTGDVSADILLAGFERLKINAPGRVQMVYLTCTDEVLQRRYTETRRRHPMAAELSVREGIAFERALLAPLQDRADLVFDTTDLSAADFRRLLMARLRLDDRAVLKINVISFAFRRGIPREADLVFDVRFLKNPHYDPDLRPKTGLDADVAAYVASDPIFDPFYARLTDFVGPLLPRYEEEGKSYLTIAIGCTGGRHRSVFIAEKLAAWLRERHETVGVEHRDTHRDHDKT